MFLLRCIALLACATFTNAIDLGLASDYAVLATTTITNTGNTLIDLNVGLHLGTSITGFPPGIVTNGALFTGSVVDAPHTSNENAYIAISNLPCNRVMDGQDLGTLVLTPGVYCFTSSGQLTGTLSLDGLGSSSSEFIFRFGSTLTTASSSIVSLINGATACNVFWQVGSSATLGANTRFKGNVLAFTSITLNAHAQVVGRVLAQNGAVTMDSNEIVASCIINQTLSSSSSSSSSSGSSSSSSSPRSSSSSSSTSPSSSSTGSSQSLPSSTAGSMKGDPQFMGFLQQSYQIHGIDNTVYSLLSDRFTQLNARFTFLDKGSCPAVSSRYAVAVSTESCFSHPGSYFGEIGLLVKNNDASLMDQLVITAGDAETGFSALSIQQCDTHGCKTARSLRLGGQFTNSDTQLTVDYKSTHEIRFRTANYEATLFNSDMFINVARFGVLNWRRVVTDLKPDGLLGQTWHSVPRQVEVDDYADADNSICGWNNIHSKFTY